MKRPCAVVLPLCISALLPAQARQAEPQPSALPRVTVSGQIGSEVQHDPVNRNVLDRDALGSALAAPDLASWLRQLPGIQAAERGNFAQDTQVSVRGHGARSSFGIRGIRLYVDGIPASTPDGQGQLSQVDLSALDSIEYIRGPLAALYGNGAGGVLKLATSRPGQARSRWSLQGDAATQGLAVQHADLRGSAAMRLSGALWRGEGARPHSRAERRNADLAVGWQNASDHRWQVHAHVFDSPRADDPLGLDAEQYSRDPFGANPLALAFTTRKSVRQGQLGIAHTARSGAWELTASAWLGQRAVEQFLAVPVAAQRSPLSGGGVIDLQRHYGGVETSLRHAGDWLDTTLGLRIETQDERRRGYENFRGGALGLRGALRRDEDNRVSGSDPYLLLQGPLGGAGSWLLGVRHAHLRFRSDDAFIRSDNPDDSGSRTFSAWIPAAGVNGTLGALGWRIAWARGFETPTANELAYRSDGSSGFNQTLRPARSRLAEVGLWRDSADWRWGLDLFLDRVDDEIVVAQSAAGRSSFRNADRTRRRGAELRADWSVHETVTSGLSWTVLDARFVGGPLDRRRLPAVAPRHGAWRIDWQASPAWRLGSELRRGGGVATSDDNRLVTASWTVLDLQAQRRWQDGDGEWSLGLALRNALDRTYVGSVIANEANGRSLETAAGRRLEVSLARQW